MELVGEVGKQCLIDDAVVETSDLLVFHSLVKRHLGKRCLDFERTVPGAPVRAVEAAALGTGVGVGRGDDPENRYPKADFSHADPPKQATLAAQPLVGSVVQIEEVSKVRFVLGEAGKHRALTRSKPRRNKT